MSCLRLYLNWVLNECVYYITTVFESHTVITTAINHKLIRYVESVYRIQHKTRLKCQCQYQYQPTPASPATRLTRETLSSTSRTWATWRRWRWTCVLERRRFSAAWQRTDAPQLRTSRQSHPHRQRSSPISAALQNITVTIQEFSTRGKAMGKTQVRALGSPHEEAEEKRWHIMYKFIVNGSTVWHIHNTTDMYVLRDVIPLLDKLLHFSVGKMGQRRFIPSTESATKYIVPTNSTAAFQCLLTVFWSCYITGTNYFQGHVAQRTVLTANFSVLSQLEDHKHGASAVARCPCLPPRLCCCSAKNTAW